MKLVNDRNDFVDFPARRIYPCPTIFLDNADDILGGSFFKHDPDRSACRLLVEYGSCSNSSEINEHNVIYEVGKARAIPYNAYMSL